MAGRGRGREMVMPAWMKQQQGTAPGYAAAKDSVPPSRDESRSHPSGSFSDRRGNGSPSGYNRMRDRERRHDSRHEGGRGRYGGGRGGHGRYGSRDHGREPPRRPSRRSRSRSPEFYRKRREERKKSGKPTNWDVAPPGVTAAPPAPNAAPMAPPVAQPNPMQGAGFSQVAQPSQMLSQQTRHARRLYVGGIEPHVTQADLATFFNDVISRGLHVPLTEHVVNVYISHERRFAFVELKGIELTTECMKLDGILYEGKPLKIRRPNDYNPSMLPPSTQEQPTLDLATLGIISTNVPDSPNKIFIGGIPYQFTEEQIKELLLPFGPLRAFHLVRDPGSSMSKGYAFAEYADDAVTDTVCASLNNIQIGDKTLTVRRATTQSAAKELIAAAGSVNRALSGETAAQPAGVTVTTMASSVPMAPPPTSAGPTKVLVLGNMVTAEEVADDNEYEEILLDVKEECAKFGSVQNVVVPRSGPALGKVFVEFAEPTQAAAASATLGGRTFAGRTVLASFYDEERFSANDLQ